MFEKLVITVSFHLKRKIAIRRKLQRISKVHKTLGKGELPKVRSHLHSDMKNALI
jgi:hypothetical protein